MLSADRCRSRFNRLGLSSPESMTSTSSDISVLAWGDRDRDLDRLCCFNCFMAAKCRERFCGMSSLLRGSEGKGGKGGNNPDGGGRPVALPVTKGNLGRPLREGIDPPGETAEELNDVPSSWAAAADTGGMTPCIFGSLNPGGKMGVIPAMGLLTKGATGKPFFSASSINCKSGG